MLEQFRTGDAELFRRFTRLGEYLVRSASLLEAMLAGTRETEGPLAQEIRRVDTDAHDLAQAADAQTFRSFFTRADRFDLHEFAASLDGLVEAVEETAQLVAALHASGAPEPLRRLARTFVLATEVLGRGVQDAGHSWEGVHAAAPEAQRLKELGETQYDEGVRQLFVGATDPIEVLRWRGVYEKLFEALRAVAFAAEHLERVAGENA